MGIFTVEPKRPGIPFCIIWRCDFKGCPDPDSNMSWPGRWNTKAARKDLRKHITVMHDGHPWADKAVTLKSMAKAVNNKNLKKEVKRGRRSSR